MHELVERLAFQGEDAGHFGVAGEQVGAQGGEDGLVVQRFNDGGRGQGGQVQAHARAAPLMVMPSFSGWGTGRAGML